MTASWARVNPLAAIARGHREISGREERETTDPDAKKMWFAASRFSYLGIFFGVAICIGYFAGRWFDDRFHTAPWLSFVGLFVGIVSGFRELYRIARQFSRQQETDDSKEQ